MFTFLIIIFSILILANVYLYLSGLQLRKKLTAISRRIAEEEISYEIKKLETAYIMEAYECLKKATFHDRFSPGIGNATNYKPISMDLYILQKVFVSFLTRSISTVNKKYKKDIKINVIDGDFSISFSQSLIIVKLLLLLAEKTVRNELGTTTIFVLAHGPVQFSIETDRLGEKEQTFNFLLQDQLMNSPTLQILDHFTLGCTERFVIGISE